MKHLQYFADYYTDGFNSKFVKLKLSIKQLHYTCNVP